jgi:hypothetical protein
MRCRSFAKAYPHDATLAGSGKEHRALAASSLAPLQLLLKDAVPWQSHHACARSKNAYSPINHWQALEACHAYV